MWPKRLVETHLTASVRVEINIMTVVTVILLYRRMYFSLYDFSMNRIMAR